MAESYDWPSFTSLTLALPIEIRDKIWHFASAGRKRPVATMPPIMYYDSQRQCASCDMWSEGLNTPKLPLLLDDRQLALDAQRWLYSQAEILLFENYRSLRKTLANADYWGPLCHAKSLQFVYQKYGHGMAVMMGREALGVARRFKEKMNRVNGEDTVIDWDISVEPFDWWKLQCFWYFESTQDVLKVILTRKA